MNQLKNKVLLSNLMLPKLGLVTLTWGNVSQICRETKVVAIKPSGVEYCNMTDQDIVLTNLEGQVIEGELKPSSDLATHIELYKAFPEIGGVVHTHSTYATAFAQAGKPIQPLGTTHADYFYGPVPVTRPLTKEEIMGEYEKNTGLVIAECFKNINPMEIPAVLVHGHGIFAWGDDAEKAVHNAYVLEQVAKMALSTLGLGFSGTLDQKVLDKHYYRKHGENAYYGQNNI